MSEDAATPEISIEQLGDLRGKTEAVSQMLRKQLISYISTLRPLLAPGLLLGKHVRSGSIEDTASGDRAFNELKERFAKVAGKPFSVSKEITEDPIAIGGKLEVHPWEYSHRLDDGKAVDITSPLRWILVYHSDYAPAQLRKLLASKESRRSTDVRQFILNALVLDALLEARPAVSQVLADLRYRVEVTTTPAFGELPLVTLSACLPSFRPADDLIRTATQFSGVSAFIELLNLEALQDLRDPQKERITAQL